MTIEVGGMSWQDMNELVQRKFNNLAMCKRGSVHTDIQKQLEELGKRPTLTKAEKEKIEKTLNTKIQKHFTPTLTQIKKYNGDMYALAKNCQHKAEDAIAKAMVHPGLATWKKKKERIEEQERARLAALDADFQDMIDSFRLKVYDITELPAKYIEMEQKEW